PQPARLSGPRRRAAHGGAHRLRPAQLLAASAARHCRGHLPRLPRAARARRVRLRPGPGRGGGRLDAHAADLPADAQILPPVAALGPGAAGRGARLYGVYPRFRLSTCTGTRWIVEGARARQRIGNIMTAAELRSGKGHHDENFPVASWLIAPRHRAPILAFYEFVRVADDIADHPSLAAPEKLGLLDRLENGLLARGGAEPVAARLRTVLAERGLSPRHAQDLVAAFRMDVTKLRYRDWDDLIH